MDVKGMRGQNRTEREKRESVRSEGERGGRHKQRQAVGLL